MRFKRRDRSQGDSGSAAEPTAHVVFDLEDDGDGWPPVGSERMWAFHLGGDRYRIDNVPWFVRDLAVGDIVEAVAPNPNRQPDFRRMFERSDHVTVRIICLRAGPMAGNLARVVEAFAEFKVYAEGAEQYGMVALDIGPQSPMRAIYERLVEGVEDGSWEYEEGRVTDAWLAATGENG